MSGYLLNHYSNDRKLVLAYDASSVGIGAVISHIIYDGRERAFANASRTLNKAEKINRQIERQALGVTLVS